MVVSTPPLGTKGSVPPTPAPFVRRRRLEALLSDGNRRTVTLVSARPGSGKTTLLAGWYREHPGAKAWLTLDPTHDAPDRLVRDVLATLVRAGALPASALDGGGADGPALVRALASLRSGRRCVLVLDDVHEVTSAAATSVLQHLVEDGPDALGVVLAARADPPFRLRRLRRTGRLGQIRGADLAFTLGEARRLLAGDGLVVGEAEAAGLWERTGGWAAGLSLAACSLTRGADPAGLVARVGADDAEVVEHLLHDVLARQDDQVQHLLLRTSVVDRFTPDLAACLADDPDAGARLAEIEHEGVFLTHLEGADWFRFHPLLARRLRVRLRERDPDLARRLQRRAAEWHARCGMSFEAAELAREGCDWPLLGAILGRRWLDAVLVGRDLPPGLVRDIAADAVAATPMLAVLAAADACRRGDPLATARHRGALGDGRPSPAALAAGDAVAVATAVLDVVTGQVFGATEQTYEAVEALAAAPATSRRTAPFLALARADLHLDADDGTAARHELEPLAADGPPGLALEAAARLALLDAQAGRLVDAADRAGRVRGAPGSPQQARAVAALASHLVAAQRGDDAEVGHDPNALPRAIGPRALRAAAVAARRSLAPEAHLTGLDQQTARHPFAGRTLVALGVLEVIDAQRRVVPAGGPCEAAVERARRALVRDDHPAVIELLTPCVALAGPAVARRTAIEVRVLVAAALHAQGARDRAVTALRDALDLASADDLLAPVLDHAAALGDLLPRVATSPGTGRVAASRCAERVRGGAPPPAVVARLTEREHVVLCFLPTMMTNAEIAESMQLSVNTVKTHLKAVYRKLDVERRRDAVARARQLELL